MNQKSFDQERIAEGYAKDRPWLHADVMKLIREEIGENIGFRHGLDIGCGAGLSTKALRLLCQEVTGVDISGEMIRLCEQLYDTPEYHFEVSEAEKIRAKPGTYEITTAAGVVNWVEEKPFLQNLGKIMCPGGILCVYDFWISDRMEGHTAYTDWWKQQYLIKFPKPFRKEEPWTQESMTGGFHMMKQSRIQLSHEFDLEAFVRFMMIQSNVNERITSGEVQEADAKKWFCKTLTEIFDGERRNLLFDGYIWYMQLEKTKDMGK